MNKIKVTHIVRQYLPSVGGMEDVVQNIARRQLEQYDQTPTIITLDRLFTDPAKKLPPESMIDGIQVIRLPYKGSSRYPLAPSILNHLTNADVIHVHGIDFFFDFLALTKLIHRKPLIASTHGGFFHTEFASRLKHIYFNTITRTSSMAYDCIIGTSKNDGDMFKEIVSPLKLSVIENGVNVEKYSDQGSLHLKPAAIYFGRWSQNKGLPEVIDLFRHLVAVNPEWTLLIAGREYDYSAAELANLVTKSGLENNVRIVPNPEQQELADLIAQASYYICLSRHEGFGIAPIEAMSAGLVPILSDIPPFRHLIEQSSIGVLVDSTDPVCAVEKILQLHTQGASGHETRRLASQNFVTRYSWRHIASRYVDLYKKLAKKNHSDV